MGPKGLTLPRGGAEGQVVGPVLASGQLAGKGLGPGWRRLAPGGWWARAAMLQSAEQPPSLDAAVPSGGPLPLCIRHGVRLALCPCCSRWGVSLVFWLCFKCVVPLLSGVVGKRGWESGVPRRTPGFVFF